MNKTVTLMRYSKTEDGWKRLPAVIGGNGRVRPGYAKHNGRLVEFSQGSYQLRYYVGSKVHYEPIGDNAAEALNKLRQKERSLTAQDAATSAGAVLVEEPSRQKLRKQLDNFVLATQDRGSNVAASVYKLASNEFLAVIGKQYADELTPDHMRQYVRALRARGLSERTLSNRYAQVKAFLRFCALDLKKLAGAAPKYEAKKVEVYSAAELTAFFASLTTDYHKLVFTLLRDCGLREQEAMYLCWPDVDYSTGMLLIRGKADLGFKVKDKEERSLPLRGELPQMLKAWREKHPGTRLILGTSGDKPNMKLLRTLKRLVKAAGMNCGACDGCREREECEGWYLHKFRATFCTKLLRSGMDMRTVQSLMGHSDIQSTMRYLRPHEDAVVRDRLEALDWTVD